MVFLLLIPRKHLNYLLQGLSKNSAPFDHIGLWDVLSHQSVAEFVMSRMTKADNSSVCKELVEWSKAKGAVDNVTALLAIFSFNGEPSQ